jgi:hypothetical protein
MPVALIVTMVGSLLAVQLPAAAQNQPGNGYAAPQSPALPQPAVTTPRTTTDQQLPRTTTSETPQKAAPTENKSQ